MKASWLLTQDPGHGCFKADLVYYPPVLSMGIMVPNPGRGTKKMCKVWERLPSSCRRVDPTFLVAFIPFSSFEVAGLTCEAKASLL